jgi:Holliday junction resolvase
MSKKIINKRSKGMALERKAQKELEKEGWLVQRAPGSTKWNKQVDLFGLFDLMALRYEKIKFVQVKCNRLPTEKETRQLEDFQTIWLGDMVCVEWWCYWNKGKRKTKQGWEKITI